MRRRLLVFLGIALAAGCASPGLADEPPPKSELELEAEALCRKQRPDGELPPYRFTTDGCSLWPDSDWRHCCVTHDMAYWCGGTAEQRAAADKALQQCLADADKPVIGSLMRVGTRLGGLSILPFPWRWGYGWPWPETGE